jgi:hypothetical protein
MILSAARFLKGDHGGTNSSGILQKEQRTPTNGRIKDTIGIDSGYFTI